MAGINDFLPGGATGGIEPFAGNGITPFVPSPGADYASLIRTTARGMGIDPTQALTLAQFESGLNPTARSSAGAYGLMQVMPGSAGGMDIYNPPQNIIRGLQLWKDALRKAHGDPQLAYRQFYNPGYPSTEAGPFGAIPTPTPTTPHAPTSPPPPPPPITTTPPGQVDFTPQPVLAPQTGTGKPGFGQFLSAIANAPGIRDVGNLWRQTLGQREPVYARSLEERNIYTHAGFIVNEAGQVFHKDGTPVSLSQADYLMTALGLRAGPTPGGSEAAQLSRTLALPTIRKAAAQAAAREAAAAAEAATREAARLPVTPPRPPIYRQQTLPLTMTRPLTIPQVKSVTRLVTPPETRQQLLLRLERERRMGLPKGHIPGQRPLGLSFTIPAAKVPKAERIPPQQTFKTIIQRSIPGLTTEEPVGSRPPLVIRQPIAPNIPTITPPVTPVTPVTSLTQSLTQLPEPISLGKPGVLARTLIPKTIQTARTADDYARGVMAAQAARQARAMGTYLSVDYKALTPDQQRNLFYSMFTSNSPVVTGKWPEWVTPQLRESLTASYRRTQEAYASLRNLSPEQREFLLGKGDIGETPYFPLLSARHAAERERLGALGRRRLHRGAGGLKAREFYSLRLPDGTSAPGMIQGQDVFQWVDGTWKKVGTALRKAPGQTIDTPAGQIRINPANPLELKQAGIHEYVENAFQSLFEREDDLTTALQVRQLMEYWKTDPKFRSVIAPPGSKIPGRGWVKAPWLGEDYYVEPHLNDVAKRLGSIPAGNPARMSLLNNWSLNISFGLWPFAHYRNMIYNWTIAIRFLVHPELFAKAFRDTNEFSPEYVRYMERGGATHYLDVQRRRVLEGALEGLNQNPRAKPILNMGGAVGSYQSWQQSVNWKMDAILQMQAIRYFMSRGLSLDDSIDLAIKRMPQYYVPAVFAAPRGFQKAADIARFIVQDSRSVVFNPFHFSQAKILQTNLGPQGFKTLAALALMDQVIWPKMEGALQHALVGYYTRKGDTQAARRASRVHITEPGLGRIVEGARVATQQLGDVLRAAPPGHRLSEAGAEFSPALGTFARSLVTASPELQTIFAGANLLFGRDPNLENLLPFGTIQEAVRVALGQASPLEAGMSFGGIYPRFFMPLELQAMQVRNALPKIAARVYSMRNAGQIHEADQLLEQTRTHLYTLNRAAVSDLQRHGFKIDNPDFYAQARTDSELRQAQLVPQRRFTLRPHRPPTAPPAPQLAP